MLWFDVERQYKTIGHGSMHPFSRLWFDVERQYKTIDPERRARGRWLWFDVERQYKTIVLPDTNLIISCGLM